MWLLVAVIAASYALSLRAGIRRGESHPRAHQPAAFGLGVATLLVAADWPVHDIAERYLLSVHMVQHLMITLIMPPLLLVGMPGWMLRRLLGPTLPLVRRLARPLPASVLFNATIVFSHWPTVVNTVLRHEPLHFATHVVLVGTASLMWLPVVSEVPEIPKLKDPGRMVYLFIQSIVPTFPASFLTFAEIPLYRFYAEAPRAFGVSAVADQQMAGALMKLAGGAILWSLIFVLFFRWYAREQRVANEASDVEPTQGDPDSVLTWSDVERQLAASPAPPETTTPT